MHTYLHKKNLYGANKSNCLWAPGRRW